MRPGKYESVGKSQPVLMMINPMVSPRTHMCDDAAWSRYDERLAELRATFPVEAREAAAAAAPPPPPARAKKPIPAVLLPKQEARANLSLLLGVLVRSQLID
jgi:hypothetical protein